MISNKYADPIYDPRNNVPEFARTRIAELEAEVERLTALHDDILARAEKLSAENERLREVCAMALRDQQGWPNRMREALAEKDDE